MLPRTGVVFHTDDAALQRLFDIAEKKCLRNLNSFGPERVLVAGGGS